MDDKFLYKVTRTDGTVHENLTYDEAFELMVDQQWDFVHFMNYDEDLKQKVVLNESK